jgi:hypothetical protein
MTNRDDEPEPLEQEPMYPDLETAALAYGWDAATVARIRADMEWTAKREPDEPLH